MCIRDRAYRYFVSHKDIHSFLCLNNALTKETGNLRLLKLKELFRLVNIECGVDENKKNYIVLKSEMCIRDRPNSYQNNSQS